MANVFEITRKLIESSFKTYWDAILAPLYGDELVPGAAMYYSIPNQLNLEPFVQEIVPGTTYYYVAGANEQVAYNGAVDNGNDLSGAFVVPTGTTFVAITNIFVTFGVPLLVSIPVSQPIKAVTASLKEFIRNALTDAPLQWQNVSFDQPKPNKYWVRLSVLFGDGQQASIGSTPREFQAGQCIVNVFGPKGVGTRPATVLADLVAAGLRYKQMQESGVVVDMRTPRIVEVGDRKDHYQINVQIEFRAQHLAPVAT